MNEPAIKALARFLAKSQAVLSIVISMRGVPPSFADDWREMRQALGLTGWHTPEEAERAIRAVLLLDESAGIPPTKRARKKRGTR